MRQKKQTIEGEGYRAGRKENRRQRKINAAIDEQAEGWRSTWRNGDPVPAPVIVLHCDIDQQKLQVPDTLMRAYVGNRQASIVGDFNLTADFQIESDQDE